MIKAVEASDPEAKVLTIMTTDATTPREAVGEVGHRVVDTMIAVVMEVVSTTEHPTVAEVVPLPIAEDVDMAGAATEQPRIFTQGRV